MINENNELTTNDKEKCDVINNFFSSVFTTEDPNNVPEFKCDKDIPNPLLNCNVSFEEFEKALLNLNPNKDYEIALVDLETYYSFPNISNHNKSIHC